MKLVKMILVTVFFVCISAQGFCDDSLIIDASGKVGIGTSTPQKALDVVGDIRASGDVCTTAGYCLSNISIPIGGIIMWSGAIADIPEGWALCDGTNGTPNLTDRFVIPADADTGGTHSPGDTGGSDTLTVENLPAHGHEKGTLATDSSGAHTHNLYIGSVYNEGSFSLSRAGNVQGSWNSSWTQSGGSHTHPITGSTANTGSGARYMPKYYALAFIMRIPLP